MCTARKPCQLTSWETLAPRATNTPTLNLKKKKSSADIQFNIEFTYAKDHEILHDHFTFTSLLLHFYFTFTSLLEEAHSTIASASPVFTEVLESKQLKTGADWH